MTKFSRSSDGKYLVKGKSYEMLIGTRAQVWHKTAYKTTGGLTHAHLMQNKSGRIVSKSKHMTAKREKRLLNAGYGTKKGTFGFVKIAATRRSRKNKRGGAASMNISASGSTQMSPSAAKMPPPTAAHATPVTTSMTKKGGRRHRRGGMHHFMSPLTGAANVTNGGRRHRRGGMHALSPAAYDGKGVGTSGVDLQFIAGNAA